MTERITQCPRCRTAFRVSAAQLQVAAGAVRCGSCLHIFDAAGHWTGPTVPAAAAPASAPPVPSTAHPVPATPDTAALREPGARWSSADSEIADTEAMQPASVDDDAAVFDDRFDPDADWLTGAAREATTGPSQYSSSFLDLDDWEEEPRSIFNEMGQLDGDLESDEEWAHQLLKELEEEDQEQPQPASSLSRDPEHPKLLARSPAHEEVPPIEPDIEPVPVDATDTLSSSSPVGRARWAGADEPGYASQSGAAEKPFSHEPQDQHQPAPADNHNVARSALPHLQAEPLELTRARAPGERSRWPAVIAVLAVIALLGQYLFFNFDRLAKGPQRPHLAQLCGWLGCELPPRAAPELIRTGNLIVRSHPDQPRALVVDAIIVNRASFPQPYPELQLVFSDLSGTVLAARDFRPEEYLAGDLASSRDMPSRQPLHVALELVDPGPRAVNYELRLGSSDPQGIAVRQ